MERQDLKPGAALAAALLAAVGGAAFVAVFRADDLVRPVGVAALAGAAVSLLVSGVLQQRLAVAAPVAAAVLVALAMVGCGATPDVVLAGWVDGGKRILTLDPPLAPEAEVLLVPYALTGVAAFLGAEIGRRARLPVASVLPSLLVLAAGLLFGIDGRNPAALGWVAAAWATIALVSQSSAVRPSLTGSVAVVLVAVPVVAAASWTVDRLPGADEREEDRFALRELWPGVQPDAAPARDDPLQDLGGWQLDEGDPVLFVADTSEPVERWRLAVLDAYDGTHWSGTEGYLPAGPELAAPAEGLRPGGQEISQTVEPQGLEPPWLPVADRAVELRGADDLEFDASAGTATAPALPARYEVVSQVPLPDTARLARAAAADDDEAERARQVPANVPAELAALAEATTQGATSDYGRAVALADLLATSTPEQPFELRADAATGSSLGDVRCFLIAEANCGTYVGSAERFVSGYAVLARLSGLPSRIVVGFRGGGVAGRDEVHAHEATAWVEVKFAGVGWVAFDPLPTPSVTITPPTTAPPANNAAPPPTQPATTLADDSDNQTEGIEDEDPSAGDSGRPWALWAALVGAVVVLGVAAPGGLRRQRRWRRRRSPNDEARLAGAWATAVDELRRSGLPSPEGMAVTDIVTAGRHQAAAAADPLVPLGVLVNRTRFGAHPPTGAEADQAWDLSDAFVARRRQNRTPTRRLREYFSVSS